MALTDERGGAKVRGVVVRPRNVPPGGAPAVLYARGGFGEAGKIRLGNLIGFQRLAERGYAVLATAYRGNHGGEGVDENGGADDLPPPNPPAPPDEPPPGAARPGRPDGPPCARRSVA